MKTTVQQLFEAHYADARSRVASGKLADKTMADYHAAFNVLDDAKLSGCYVKSIGPLHFSKLMECIEKSGRSLRTQKNLVTAIKTVFKWGGPEGMSIVDRVSFGPRFKAPPLRSIEIQQEENSPSRFLDRETILAALDVASPEMRVAILLGINCGFYPSDTIAITGEHIRLDGYVSYHEFRRTKTGQKRKAVLWPETIEAITRLQNPIDGQAKLPTDVLLLTKFGLPYASTRNIIRKFSKLLDKLGRRTSGVSLGSLRHTYATIVDSIYDQTMIDLTMGHTNSNIQKRTYRQLNLNELSRLEVLAETVREWLLGIKQRKVS